VDPKTLSLNSSENVPKNSNEPLAKLGIVLSIDGVPQDVNPLLRPSDSAMDPLPPKTPKD
jgi:hypothetical protein